jgi:PAS domain S-box-containing protein
MSRRYDEKKEAFEILNKELSDLIPLDQRVLRKQEELKGKTAAADLKKIPKEWLDEQAALFEKYKLIERVYRFYRNIIQNMSSRIITIDMNGSITFLNSNAAVNLGYSVEELLGRNLLDLFADPEETGKLIDLMLIENKRFESREVRLLAKNGTVIPIGFSTSPLIENTEQTGVILTFRDLTEMNLMRLQVERMDRLATLGELATGIAHEVRNPLSGIKAAAQVLEESFEDSDRRIELVSRIVREIDRVNNLLTEFFKFAKPVKPSREYHDVESIIDSVYLLLAAQMSSKQIKFREEFSNVVPKVFADMQQVEQILMNLFLNAIQALPKEGELIVRTYSTTIGEKPNLNWSDDVFDKNLPFVSIEVEDTGGGIPPENLEKIWNPFFTTKSDGMGLGLAICSRLAAENHGYLNVESKVGKGTKFTLLLPTR